MVDGLRPAAPPADSLASEPIRGAALAVAARVPRLSVDLSSTAVLRDHGVGRFRDLLDELRPETASAPRPRRS